MCGIVGFTGRQQAAPVLLNGLSKLEYRGYDSSGLAVRDGESLAEVVKATGKLKNLADKTMEKLCREHAVSAIQDGRHMASHHRTMRTRTSAEMRQALHRDRLSRMLSESITELSRTMRSLKQSS